MNKKIFFVLAAAIIFVNIACDQGTKHYARKNYKNKGTVRVIGDYFIIRYTENTGAFLGMGANLPQPWKAIVLSIIPAVLIIVMTVYMLCSKELTRFQLICIACIIGGGISNIFDRFMYQGAVTDFLHFNSRIGMLRTGILNFADMSITFGVILLLISQMREDYRRKKLASAGLPKPYETEAAKKG